MRKALYLLGQLNDLDVEWLIEAGQRRRVDEGVVLIRQGRPVQDLYLVLAGRLSVIDEKLDGRELARLGVGEIVGEMSFVDARPPSATVMVFEDSVVLALPRERLQQRLNDEAAFAARFYRALALFLSDRLRSTVSRLGYGAPATTIGDEMQEDELDLNVLNHVHLAGARFDHILKRLLET